MTVPGADGCDQLVDDGGDATLLMHKVPWCLFWPSTNYECFIGDFAEGRPPRADARRAMGAIDDVDEQAR